MDEARFMKLAVEAETLLDAAHDRYMEANAIPTVEGMDGDQVFRSFEDAARCADLRKRAREYEQAADKQAYTAAEEGCPVDYPIRLGNSKYVTLIRRGSEPSRYFFQFEDMPRRP